MLHGTTSAMRFGFRRALILLGCCCFGWVPYGALLGHGFAFSLAVSKMLHGTTSAMRFGFPRALILLGFCCFGWVPYGALLGHGFAFSLAVSKMLHGTTSAMRFGFPRALILLGFCCVGWVPYGALLGHGFAFSFAVSKMLHGTTSAMRVGFPRALILLGFCCFGWVPYGALLGHGFAFSLAVSKMLHGTTSAMRFGFPRALILLGFCCFGWVPYGAFLVLWWTKSLHGRWFSHQKSIKTDAFGGSRHTDIFKLSAIWPWGESEKVWPSNLLLVLESMIYMCSFQLQDIHALYCYFFSLPPCVKIIYFRACSSFEVVAVSQAPSPESNPNSPSPLIATVGQYPTVTSWYDRPETCAHHLTAYTETCIAWSLTSSGLLGSAAWAVALKSGDAQGIWCRAYWTAWHAALP